ncbi:MAG: hypothetical protein ACFCVF_16290 [Kineosporiaceae bacterium]
MMIAGLMIAGLTPTATADAVEESDIVIDGRTYGPEDGLVVEEGELPLDSAGGATLRNVSYDWGSSYARSRERLQYWYDGSAYAAGNRYGSERIIRVGFKYTRDGADLISWRYSNARSSNCTWSGGSVATATVRDTLDPNAPPTRFRYSTSRINPNVC